ncbi:hypothetical protein HDU96_007197 [Phlyctochytrium bullatum]|nr:hypothetical protein HDU96_007197 [Phlyctochytrium bullatum]
MVTNIESPPRAVTYDQLEELSAQVAKAFITSRVKAADEDLKDTIDLFDDEANLSNILELLAPTIRLKVKYNETSDFINSYLDILGSQYEVGINLEPSNTLKELVNFVLANGISNAIRDRSF